MWRRIVSKEGLTLLTSSNENFGILFKSKNEFLWSSAGTTIDQHSNCGNVNIWIMVKQSRWWVSLSRYSNWSVPTRWSNLLDQLQESPLSESLWISGLWLNNLEDPFDYPGIQIDLTKVMIYSAWSTVRQPFKIFTLNIGSMVKHNTEDQFDYLRGLSHSWFRWPVCLSTIILVAINLFRT